MLVNVPKVVPADEVQRRQFLLNGLWASGMRIGEAVALSWDAHAEVRLSMNGEFPMIDFASTVSKNRKDQTVPVSPEFACLLDAVPSESRHGLVFGITHQKLWCSKIVARIGKSAGIKVSQKSGKVQYASAHDLRRSFGFRWAEELPAHHLQLIMRHEDIKTTLEFYVCQNAIAAAKRMWKGFANGSTNGRANP